MENDKINFIILSPEANFVRLKNTLNSIKYHLGTIEATCVVPKNIDKSKINDLQNICNNVFKGKNTFTSLINSGFKHSKKEWNIILFEGVYVKKSLLKKYRQFITSDKDILFPIDWSKDVQGKPKELFCDFWNCNLNGVLINKKIFNEIGNFSDNLPLEISKLIWSATAVNFGCKLKGIIGLKMI